MSKEGILINDDISFPVILHGEGYNQVLEYKEIFVFNKPNNEDGGMLIDPTKVEIEKVGEPENGFQEIKVVFEDKEGCL